MTENLQDLQAKVIELRKSMLNQRGVLVAEVRALSAQLGMSNPLDFTALQQVVFDALPAEFTFTEGVAAACTNKVTLSLTLQKAIMLGLLAKTCGRLGKYQKVEGAAS